MRKTSPYRKRISDRSAARSSGTKERRHSEKKYFSDDARAKLLAAFIKNNYPDNDIKDQLAVELDLTPTQVNTWFSNRRNRYGKEVYSGFFPANSPDAGEIKQDVEIKSERRDPKIDDRNDQLQEPSRGHLHMEGVLGNTTIQRQSDPPPKPQPRPIDGDFTNNAPKQIRTTDVVPRMMHLLQGGSIVRPENVGAFVELMEKVEDDLETMRTMLIALQASTSLPVQKMFVDSAGLLVLQKWMKLARKDPTNPPCLQVLEKAILILRELPLAIRHLQASTVGKFEAGQYS
ncbi:hypothetical protein BGZ81_007497 [Podila clonocystis]|nr:hypothetical protein BGZ81_007497 [Podila clonocystis]